MPALSNAVSVISLALLYLAGCCLGAIYESPADLPKQTSFDFIVIGGKSAYAFMSPAETCRWNCWKCDCEPTHGKSPRFSSCAGGGRLVRPVLVRDPCQGCAHE